MDDSRTRFPESSKQGKYELTETEVVSTDASRVRTRYSAYIL